ncbi:hypothetical protein H8E77_25880 [bacterium]|nr:hypothetical protein [bacterium]
MPQLVQRFEIYLPLRYNDGTMIPEEQKKAGKIREILDELSTQIISLKGEDQ